MRLQTRLRKLDTLLPKCDSRTMLLAPMGHVSSEADRCPWCGGCHVLVIDEVIVASPADAERATGVEDREPL